MESFKVDQAGWYEVSSHFGARQVRPGVVEMVQQASEIWLMHQDADGNITDAELKDFRIAPTHGVPHFNRAGYCVCRCDECGRWCEFCCCLDCPCDSDEEAGLHVLDES